MGHFVNLINGINWYHLMSLKLCSKKKLNEKVREEKIKRGSFILLSKFNYTKLMKINGNKGGHSYIPPLILLTIICFLLEI